MWYSPSKHKFLGVPRRKKLIVLSLQVLLWLLKISPRMFPRGARPVCLAGEPWGRRCGGRIGGLAGETLSLGSPSRMECDTLLPQPHICMWSQPGDHSKAWSHSEAPRGTPSTTRASRGRRGHCVKLSAADEEPQRWLAARPAVSSPTSEGPVRSARVKKDEPHKGADLD